MSAMFRPESARAFGHFPNVLVFYGQRSQPGWTCCKSPFSPGWGTRRGVPWTSFSMSGTGSDPLHRRNDICVGMFPGCLWRLESLVVRRGKNSNTDNAGHVLFRGTNVSCIICIPAVLPVEKNGAGLGQKRWATEIIVPAFSFRRFQKAEMEADSSLSVSVFDCWKLQSWDARSCTYFFARWPGLILEVLLIKKQVKTIYYSGRKIWVHDVILQQMMLFCINLLM